MAIAHGQRQRRDTRADRTARGDPPPEMDGGADARPNGYSQANGAYDPSAARGSFASAASAGIAHGVHPPIRNGKDAFDPWDPRFDDFEPAGRAFGSPVRDSFDGGVRVKLGRACLWAALLIMAGVFSFQFFSGVFS